jgi:hypothetical protein
VMVEYTHNDADEFYRRMNVNVWRWINIKVYTDVVSMRYVIL